MFIAIAPSLLERIHPFQLLEPLASLGMAASCWMLLAGVLVALAARRSQRSSAWIGAVGMITLGFLHATLRHSNDSIWMFAALAGTSLLCWVVLTPLFTRWWNACAPVLWCLAGIALVFDVAELLAWGGIALATPTQELQNPWISAAFGMWQLIAVALLLGLLAYKGRMLQPWFRHLALAHVGGAMVVYGASQLLGYGAPAPFYRAPTLYLTATAAGVWVSLLVAQRWPTQEDILERYRPYALVAGTHVFLICFTIATLYPVLWVLKMAVTPQQGFILGINPVPQPVTQYIKAWRQGDREAATCYKRALLQNFREVMGQGSACADQICGAWRHHNDRWLLRERSAICGDFANIWKTDIKSQLGPPPQTKDALALAVWQQKQIRQKREKLFAHWRTQVVARRTSPESKAATAKLLDEMIHQQKERQAQGSLFWRQVLNSVLVALVTTFLGLFLACTAAYAFSRFRFPGRRIGLMSFLVSQMFPGTLMMIPLYILISRLGLLNSLVGLTLVYSTTSIPFCVWMLKGYFDTIPKELEEAALIDGASRTLIFWKIMLPLARPAIAVTALFSFMTAWNEFILAVTFMNDKTSFTLPVMLRQYVGSHNTEWGHFAAGAVLVSLPIVLLFFVLQKNLVGGLTAGGVKG